MGEKKFRMFADMTLRKKLIGVGIALLIIALGLFLITVIMNVSHMTEIASSSIQKAVRDDLDHIISHILNLCQTQDKHLQRMVTSYLSVAKRELENRGGLSLAQEKIEWNPLNQFSKERVKITLPKVLLGKQWIGRDEKHSFVDMITSLTGATCTVFQDMGPEGMLRISTTVKDEKGERAINTYIPRRQPDGTLNPVIQAVASGATYTGWAFVVTKLYYTAYEPIRDAAGNLLGMLYVGIPADQILLFLETLRRTKIGDEGYIFILDRDGKYILSDREELEGKDELDATYGEKTPPLRTILSTAQTLQPLAIKDTKFLWRNTKDTATQEVIARYGYFKPWRWTLGVVLPQHEFQKTSIELQKKGTELKLFLILASIILAFVASLIFYWLGNRIVNPIISVSNYMRKIAEGDLTQTIPEPTTRDEIASLLHSLRTMSTALTQQIREIRAGIHILNGTSNLMNELSTQVAASANQTATSIAQTTATAEEIRQTTQATGRHAQRVNENMKRASEMIPVSWHSIEESTQKTQAIVRHMESITSCIINLSEKASTIAEINTVVEDLAEQSQLLAVNAEMEAVKAGEAGKGFSVLAEEIRSMAQGSKQATQRVGAILKEISSSALAAVEAAKQGCIAAKEGNDEITRMRSTIEKLIQIAMEAAQSAMEIEEAVRQQLAGMDQVARAMDQAKDASEKNAENAKDLQTASEDIHTFADRMATIVSRYTIS